MSELKALVDNFITHFDAKMVPFTYRFLAKHGKTYFMENEGKATGEPRNCYNNCMYEAVRDQTKFYAEGLAYHKPIGVVIPISHAWLLDKDGKVIDPTWENVKGDEYLGVKFDIDFILELTSLTKYVSVFENLHMLRMASYESLEEYLLKGMIRDN